MSFTHLDNNNNPSMVDVSEKAITKRTATAQSIVVLTDEIMANFKDGDLQTKKGSVLQTAIIAGTMGAKKTSDLIPLCHPLGLDSCKFKIEVIDNEVIIKFSLKNNRQYFPFKPSSILPEGVEYLSSLNDYLKNC